MAKKKTLVLFADGTGNAFTTQESNVWRLYEAVDQSNADQMAMYIQGVGTSGVRLFAALDGATGIGVPGNVRKLYQFLCWNWNPGDDIFVFGFSRGAFTIRTLIGMMDREGLVPRRIDGERVTRAEMDRNVMAAWRSYRAKTIPWGRKSLPSIWIVRAIRDAWLALFHGVARHRGYDRVRWETDRQQRRTVPITFAGLFDSVEAFGVPMEELRLAIDYAFWPISFRNKRISSRVRRVRHALALDDERTSFHPLRIEQTPTTGDVREVWFAGVHSDVGGGYPDGALANVPLAWMADEAVAAGLGLDRLAHAGFRSAATAFGPIHDSRAGMAVTYRYDPRPVAASPETGGDPVIHHSVAERMVFGVESYAPLTLPSTVAVLMPDGTTRPIQGFGPTVAVPYVPPPGFAANIPTPAPATPLATALLAVRALSAPVQGYVELARDTIWWRRTAYFALVCAALLALSLPLSADPLGQWLNTGLDRLPAGSSFDWVRAAMRAESGFSGNLGSFFDSIGGLLPGYAGGYVTAVVGHPFICAAILLAVLTLYAANRLLRYRIVDRALCAWFSFEVAGPVVVPPPSAPLRLARTLRTSKAAAWVYRAFSVAVPALVIVAAFLAMFVTVSRTTVTSRAAGGSWCDDAVAATPLGPGEVRTVPQPFRAHARCWASGVRLESGRHYRIKMEMRADDPFFDQHMISSVIGFHDRSLRHILALPFRRWLDADWFQPIARIGRAGNVEWPLVSVDGARAPAIDPRRDVVAAEMRLEVWQAVPDEDRREFLETHALPPSRRTLVAEVVAPGDGELFLYLNDAIVAIPFGPDVERFYDNNAGSADVTIERIGLPDVGPARLAQR